ncbi:MAG: hypothetical protein JSS62_06120 [Verrucomicrobia bacterium]|nr:hypothetical protein [Verrucomicrobiota bacterium]MBS0645775.1 hypothetical protein [Verrucomicrobiota bacterium]
MIRKILVFLILSCSCVAFHSCGREIDAQNARHSVYLFLVFAQQADVHYAADDASEVYLTLRKVSEVVTYLTAQLNPRVGMLPIHDFLKKWKEGSVLVSDQSGILYVSDNQVGNSRVRLQYPRYDEIADSLTFEMTIMDSIGTLRAEKITDVAIYIDSMAAL